jgi:hypothetical protein
VFEKPRSAIGRAGLFVCLAIKKNGPAELAGASLLLQYSFALAVEMLRPAQQDDLRERT